MHKSVNGRGSPFPKRIKPKGTVNAKSAEAGKDLASRDDKTKPFLLLQNEQRDHQVSRDDVSQRGGVTYI